MVTRDLVGNRTALGTPGNLYGPVRSHCRLAIATCYCLAVQNEAPDETRGSPSHSAIGPFAYVGIALHAVPDAASRRQAATASRAAALLKGGFWPKRRKPASRARVIAPQDILAVAKWPGFSAVSLRRTHGQAGMPQTAPGSALRSDGPRTTTWPKRLLRRFTPIRRRSHHGRTFTEFPPAASRGDPWRP